MKSSVMNLRVRVLVLNTDGVPDSNGDCFMPDSVELDGVGRPNPLNAVPVCLGFDTMATVGRAVLSKEGNAVFADITVGGDKLSKEELEQLTPAVGGKMSAKVGNTVYALITDIGLTSGPNSDHRIKKIGEM